jgi:hypothetical protein
MIEFRERFAQALLVHRLDHRTGARVKSGTINLDPADLRVHITKANTRPDENVRFLFARRKWKDNLWL